jgi:hypothetical protein
MRSYVCCAFRATLALMRLRRLTPSFSLLGMLLITSCNTADTSSDAYQFGVRQAQISPSTSCAQDQDTLPYATAFKTPDGVRDFYAGCQAQLNKQGSSSQP